ncbi:MAG: TetR/AcrR family transcriptional regulator [Candidatus Accumulibacter sp.]|nr:TetR/AcrR family transcriptional regulator [Accumulibacter sp.]
MNTDEAFAASDVSSAAAQARKAQPRGRRSARKLLDAAAALFLEKGVDKTTVDDVVLRAGIAKGTFYYHYESRAALFNALHERVIGDFEARIEAAMAACPPGDPWRQLDTWVETTCESYLEMGPLHDIVFSADSPRWSVSNRKFVQILIALLGEGHARGVWRVDDPCLTATFIFCGLHGAIDDLILAGRHPTIVARSVIAFTRKAVALD